MSTIYTEPSAAFGQAIPQKVNLRWFSEAWSLFRANAGLWISAVVIGLFGPAVIDGFIVVFYNLANNLALHMNTFWSIRSTLQHLPVPLVIGLGLLNALYMALIVGGMGRMAVKLVTGQAIHFGDIISGGSIFPSIFGFGVFFILVTSVGFVLVIIPALYVSTLLLPAFALIADGVGLVSAISRSAAGMKNDRFSGMLFVFIFSLALTVSALPLGLGLLVTLPMATIISALAYRDMVGIPRLQQFHFDPGPLDVELEGYDVPPADPDVLALGGPRQLLTGESVDEFGNVISPPK